VATQRDRLGGEGVSIEGLNKLLRALEQMDEQAKADFKAAGLKAAEPVIARARQEVPVRSGALQGSIRSALTSRGVRIRAGSKKVPYANAIHFGQKRDRRDEAYRFRRVAIKPNPFMFRAVDATKDEVLAVYEQHVIEIWNRNV
jgi:HK97 gp10 family phage protein